MSWLLLSFISLSFATSCDREFKEPVAVEEEGQRQPPEQPVTPPVDGGTQEPLTFQKVYDEVLNAECRSCHNPRYRGNGVDVTTWEAIQEIPGLVVPGKPEESLLYTVSANGSMPPMDPMDAAQINLIRQWILSLQPE